MDQNSEKLNPHEKERLELYQSKNPFEGIEPSKAGKYTSKTFDFAGVGDLVFYASPNIGQVDTKKYFQNPRRIWAELSFPDGTPQKDIESNSLGLSIIVQCRNNQSIILRPQSPYEQKVLFDIASRPEDTVEPRTSLIEDASFLPEMVIEVTNDLS